MIDFSLSTPQQELQTRVRAFVQEEVVPFEKDPRWTDHGPTDELRRELNELARREGLLAPQVSRQLGGMGLTHVERAIVFEAAGWSMLGPVAMHCAAPDEGNMHLLDALATDAQKERWLVPLAAAKSRSAFAMTEPAPGAGSDPAQLMTEARWDGSAYLIRGRKWLITGGHGADLLIVMANVIDGPHGSGPTMFLVDGDAAGIERVRRIDSLDQSFTGGHAEIALSDVRVERDAVLGEVGEGLPYAQVRLAPARLTHCMRWLGSAARAQSIATEYAVTRTAFGSELAAHEGIGFQLADNEVDLRLARLITWRGAWELDQGGRGGMESSIAKLFVSESLFRVADRCVQILGGLGLTRDTPIERIFRDLRAFRVYDGASEVHRWSIAKRVSREAKSRRELSNAGPL